MFEIIPNISVNTNNSNIGQPISYISGMPSALHCNTERLVQIMNPSNLVTELLPVIVHLSAFIQSLEMLETIIGK